MERLHSFVSELLPGATQSEIFGGRVVYKVPKEGVGVLSIIFHKLEKGMMFTKTVLICDLRPYTVFTNGGHAGKNWCLVMKARRWRVNKNCK